MTPKHSNSAVRSTLSAGQNWPASQKRKS